MYSIKEIFYSLQGEGAHAGRPAIFCRFTGCNLWSGREVDRAKAACNFCDTDFIGTDGNLGGKYATPEALVQQLRALWPEASAQPPYVVCTGGEPLLQLDKPLIDALHADGFIIAVETNGTQPLPAPVDWVCVSPKGSSALVLTQGNELKLVYPQPGVDPSAFSGLAFDYFFIQPCDTGVLSDTNARQILASAAPEGDAAVISPKSAADVAVDYCLRHPQWRLSLQTHKLLGIE